jgi:hypothetical protein
MRLSLSPEANMNAGKYAAAVAGQVYRALGPQLVRTDRNLAQTEFKIRPRIVAGAPIKGNVADEDGDEDDAAMSSAFGEKGRYCIRQKQQRHPGTGPHHLLRTKSWFRRLAVQSLYFRRS